MFIYIISTGFACFIYQFSFNTFNATVSNQQIKFVSYGNPLPFSGVPFKQKICKAKKCLTKKTLLYV